MGKLKAKVLLVEGGEQVAPDVKRSLNKAGHDVVIAESQDAAVEAFKKGGFGVIILGELYGGENCGSATGFLNNCRAEIKDQNLFVICNSPEKSSRDEQQGICEDDGIRCLSDESQIKAAVLKAAIFIEEIRVSLVEKGRASYLSTVGRTQSAPSSPSGRS